MRLLMRMAFRVQELQQLHMVMLLRRLQISELLDDAINFCLQD
jgi:hypothetical protein